jgi:hypothetical protein
VGVLKAKRADEIPEIRRRPLLQEYVFFFPLSSKTSLCETDRWAGHCDDPYTTLSGDEVSFFTLQLYLNGSVSNGGDVNGGATTFHSADMTRSLDVLPKTGRVLIFQHMHLVHSGAQVLEGIKYTMKTDLLYRRCG